MEPLTREDLERMIDALFKQRTRPNPGGSCHIDFDKLHKHGIGYFFEGDLVLFSSSGLKKAKEIGAVTNV